MAYSYRVATVDGSSGGIISGDVNIQSDLTVSGKATIGPGHTNSGNSGFVAGASNSVRDYGTVAGGSDNNAYGRFSAILGGRGNFAEGDSSCIGGGVWNTAGHLATIGGGKANVAEYLSTVGGGMDNAASGYRATVGGGRRNTASGNYAMLGGGYDNLASGEYATVAGGWSNTASAKPATVGGGYDNLASAAYATVGGGGWNTASGRSATVGGGSSNSANDTCATVGGGSLNDATGAHATVAGGHDNNASGKYATVGGGYWNKATGTYSFAAGHGAWAEHDGSFVWADYNPVSAITSTATDQFTARCKGGVRFITGYTMLGDITAGVEVAAGGTSWSSLCDRNLKENYAPVDAAELLRKVAALPVMTWNGKAQDPSIRHIGPVAQDFYAAFGVGEDDTHITTVDADGVALAAIQGLYQKNTDLKKRVEQLEALVAQLLEDKK